MEKATISRLWATLTTPFRVIWRSLSQISNLSSKQVRSLTSVAFLAGMISLSAENWGITFVAGKAAAAGGEGMEHLFGFLLERMRYISILQGWLALILGAVIIGADVVRVKIGSNEASLGGKGDDE